MTSVSAGYIILTSTPTSRKRAAQAIIELKSSGPEVAPHALPTELHRPPPLRVIYEYILNCC